MGVIVWPRPVCLISTLPLPGQGGAVFPERGDWKASEEASEAGQLLQGRERQALQYLSALRRSLDGFSTLFWPVGDLHSQLSKHLRGEVLVAGSMVVSGKRGEGQDLAELC